MKKLFTLGPQVHGHGTVIFSWQPGESLVATIGEGQRNLVFFDRRGVQVDEVALRSTSKVLQLEWDKDGEILAILQQNEANILLWRHAEKKLEVLEMNTKDPTYLSWSKAGPQLMIGSAKGNLMIYNKRTMKKQTIMGKHTKAITCGSWYVEDNIFAIAAEDRTLTINTEEGESKLDGDEPVRLKAEPYNLLFAMIRNETPNESQRDKVVSLMVGESSLLLCNLRDPHKPTELTFQPKYGTIKSYCWHEEHLVIGFSLGYVVVLSAHRREMQEELASVKYHTNYLEKICSSPAAGKVASAGDDGIKIISAKDWREVKSERIQVRPEARVTQMHWSSDGELLTVCTDGGWIYCYLAKLSALSAVCSNRMAYLTSLREMTVIEGANDQGNKVVVQLDVEPAFAALGPSHIATGMNNRVWYYSCSPQSQSRLVNEQDYTGTVESVSLNATHACVLISGRVHLHPIDREGSDSNTLIFPKQDGEKNVTCASIVGGFLIYAQSNGRLSYYSLADGTDVNEYTHESGIKRCYPNQEGTRCVIIDKAGDAFLYNPVNDDCVRIKEFPSTVDRVLWDTVDSTVFITVDPHNIFSFVYSQAEIGGSGVKCLGNVEIGPDGDLRIDPAPTSLGSGHSAILLVDGSVVSQQASGTLSQTRLRSHELLAGVGGAGMHSNEGVERQRASFRQALALNRFQLAFKIGLALNGKDLWTTMGRKCLECLDIGWAKKAYRQAPSPGMVLYLEKLSNVEDKQLLSGHVASLFGRFNKARNFFLQSCCPEAALELHCDFHQWDQALALAPSLAPHRLPEIYLKSAMKFENQNDNQAALTHYEQALQNVEPERLSHIHQCRAGIARSSIRVGDLQRGIKEAMALQDPALSRECGALLKDMKQNGEAAQLYEQAGAYEKAAELYIQDKMFEAAAPLLQKIHKPSLHKDYAKAKEAKGAFREALAAFKKADDLDSVVRLYLDKLNEPQEAFQLVRESPFVEGAVRVAQYCHKSGNVCGQVEFWLLSGRPEEAYAVAEKHDEMETFERILGDNAKPEQYLTIARYYEHKSMLSQAARQYCNAQDYAKALSLYKKVGEKEIDNAIEVVGKARDDRLTQDLMTYLLGDDHHLPKDPSYVYKLQKALGNYMQAAATALIIAKKDQEEGNYKQAHQLLFRTYQELKQQKLALPQELWRRLLTLHSYVIVKRLVKAGDHLTAAHMLLRVAKNIFQFPAHIVPILTSVVIECQRAKLTNEAYTYSCMLMRPEHRPHVSEQYKKKIENIVRKPVADIEGATQESQSPCIYCGERMGDSELDCSNCKNISPFCIVTGMRMQREDWSYCPHCNFPAKHSAFTGALQISEQCPMCEEPVKVSDLPVVHDPSPMIAACKSLFQSIEYL